MRPDNNDNVFAVFGPRIREPAQTDNQHAPSIPPFYQHRNFLVCFVPFLLSFPPLSFLPFLSPLSAPGIDGSIGCNPLWCASRR